MCAIIGAVVTLRKGTDVGIANSILASIWEKSHERGRDGRGWDINQSSRPDIECRRDVSKYDAENLDVPYFDGVCDNATFIANLRAEPTTEHVRNKKIDDQQPYRAGMWSIAHNGTIANDKELRTHVLPTTIDSAAIVEQLAKFPNPNFNAFVNVMGKLKGSFAIIASNGRRNDCLYVAANYRPIWYIETEFGFFFASSRHYLPEGYSPQMLLPYTAADFRVFGIVQSESLYKSQPNNKALVVCSGGLDSVVSAAFAQKRLGLDIHLIHFMYGSRAEGPEVKAVQAVAQALGAELTLFPLPVYRKEDSPLLDPDSKVAGGEEGAEFAHEWVPARNLLLLSVATAFAEARGIETIVLGNNLEEAGAYPDNEPEFIAKFNDLLPFAVGDGKRMKVIMPVGNMMKHEIVALGDEVGAPMHLTWSCYRAGALHCGKCGPCFMRRTAFEINNLPEVIQYESNQ